MNRKNKKGIALITVIVFILVIFAFILGLSVVIDKNLKFFDFISKKTTAHSLAKSATEYMTVKTDAGISWTLVSGAVYTSGEVQVDPDRPYYFEIRDTSRLSAAATNSVVPCGEYQFIGIVKNRAGGRAIARTVLRVIKPAATFKDSWTE